MMTVTKSAYPRRVEPLTVEQQGEGVYVVILAGKGKLFITNATGRRVLDLCDGTKTLEEIVDLMHSEYPGVDRAQIQSDVEKWLEVASAKGVIEWS